MENCRRKCRHQYLYYPVPDKTKINKFVKKLTRQALCKNKKPQGNKRVLTDEKLHEIGFRLDQNPQ